MEEGGGFWQAELTHISSQSKRGLSCPSFDVVMNT